jgi:hypothetical protein
MKEIPKRIIQTAKHRDLPLKHRAMTASLRLLNPDYECRFFDDADVEAFIDREFPEFRRVFDAFPYPIQRYDFFRYLAVYRLGGFYFDLDVLLASDLSSLLHTRCVFPFEGLTFSRLLRDRGVDWEIGNYAFGATAEHPFLKAVIENCLRAHRDPRWASEMMRGVPLLSRPDYEVLITTGPGLLSRTLAEHPELARDVTVLFPEDVSDPGTWHLFGSLGVHLMEGSWRSSGSFLRTRLAQRLEAFALQRLVKQSRARGKSRTVPGSVSRDTEPEVPASLIRPTNWPR